MAGFNIAGKTVSDLLNMGLDTFLSLPKSALSKVVSRMGKTANQRLKSFEKAGKNSPAVAEVERSGGKFSAKGKDLNELRKEYARLQSFYENKTSTLRGYNKFEKDTISNLRKSGVEITPEQFADMWKIYGELYRSDPAISHKEFKYEVLKRITATMKDTRKTTDQIIEELTKQLNTIYENQAEMSVDNGVSQFFEIE